MRWIGVPGGGFQVPPPEDLDGLAGPVSGRHALPSPACGWVTPYRVYDLGSRVDRVAWVETVIRHAATPRDLTDFLAADLLAAVWPALLLPGWAREWWEDAHPHLAQG